MPPRCARGRILTAAHLQWRTNVLQECGIVRSWDRMAPEANGSGAGAHRPWSADEPQAPEEPELIGDPVGRKLGVGIELVDLVREVAREQMPDALIDVRRRGPEPEGVRHEVMRGRFARAPTRRHRTRRSGPRWA